ncbi:PAS domain-containing protein [Mucilaginibacter glaciei]|uniref:histidine kinase n=1 Tax=Mucilaginibacter glaciei TaxID=2772109 RepID=A0A926S1K4_9SPHI|nr:PAS domain-containing protein [Mucilaginibacter glaciei]MBD1393173.1 PAS domain-containing protein [Mucilaginibacter glaciei]
MKRFRQITGFLANSSVFYTIAINLDSKYVFVSNNYNRNFDQSNGSLLGKNFSVTLHPDDIRICAEVGMKCLAQPGELFPATLRKHDGKGGFVVTQWEMSAYCDISEQPAGIFCIGYNITEYIDTQIKLEDATLEIVGKNDQLNEIGFIQSHVVRKPLANIIGLADLLEGADMNSQEKSIVGMMVSSAKELDLMIRDISNKIV